MFYLFFIKNFIVLLFIFLYGFIFQYKLYDDTYLKLLNKYIIKNGVIPIKIAQWLSTEGRTGIFENKFNNLHNNCPIHSFEYTNKILYDNNLHNDIVFINKKPLFSGSIGQVYLVKYNDKESILKVIHPNIEFEINFWFKVIDFLLKFVFKDFIDINDLKINILN